MYVGDLRRGKKESKVSQKAAYQSLFPLPPPRLLPSFSSPFFGSMGEIWDLRGALAAYI